MTVLVDKQGFWFGRRKVMVQKYKDVLVPAI